MAGKGNPYHVGKGSPKGGQFTTGGGGGSSATDKAKAIKALRPVGGKVWVYRKGRETLVSVGKVTWADIANTEAKNKEWGSAGSKYGLSEDEQTLLFDWTSGPETASFAPTKKDMDIKLRKSAEMTKVLEKLPVFKGTVYRGLELTSKEIAKYRVGAIVNMTLHSSASKNKMVAGVASETWWAGTDSVILQIETKTGRAIPKDFTNFEHEKEVVLLKGTRYKVTGKSEGKATYNEEGDKVRHIVIKMKEI